MTDAVNDSSTADQVAIRGLVPGWQTVGRQVYHLGI